MKIVFLCHFSNSLIRNHLDLKEYAFTNLLLKLLCRSSIRYDDFAIWVSEYIREFENHKEYEFHIVAPHKGMKRKFQHFEINGIKYHFFKSDCFFIKDVLKDKLHIQENNDYRLNRNRIRRIIETIQPDIVLLCGAENPYYSLGVLDIKNIPIYVILQTLLNDSKRIKMGVGNTYRRRVEHDIFKHADFFCTYNDMAVDYIKKCNEYAQILPVRFPTHYPQVILPNKKVFDFVFFARIVTKNKGVEDLLHATSIIAISNPNVKLNIIGNVSKEYKKTLDEIIKTKNITNNIHFSGYYQNIEETYTNVVKAKITVVPGITEALNSTVRESMFMGQPTICYEAPSTLKINENKQCLFLAKMSNVDDLACKMLFALENEEQIKQIAQNGKEYADREFSNKAIVDKLLENCKLIKDIY